jgi:hypothetical protein
MPAITATERSHSLQIGRAVQTNVLNPPSLPAFDPASNTHVDDFEDRERSIIEQRSDRDVEGDASSSIVAGDHMAEEWEDDITEDPEEDGSALGMKSLLQEMTHIRDSITQQDIDTLRYLGSLEGQDDAFCDVFFSIYDRIKAAYKGDGGSAE